MNPVENIKLAFESIQSNFLRSLLTLMIVAVGIASLVGILSAIDGLLYSMSDNFNRLGANSFKIYPSSETIQSRNNGRRRRRGEPIVYDQALEFKDDFVYAGSKVSVDTYCTGSATIKYKNEKTNPTIRVTGIDENYFITSSFEMEEGRNFTFNEVLSGNNRIILAQGIVDKLFDDKADKAIGQSVFVGNTKYKVVGTLSKKGNSTGGGDDNQVFIPLNNAKKLYGNSKKHYNVTVAVANSGQVDDAVSQSIGVMRRIRKLKASEKNDFDIRKSDGILEQLKDMTSTLRLATIVIVSLTLLGAAIGLMNIMLVSVTERTREIGVRKALGATSNNVLVQFLTEAVTICIFGGLAGILLGILIGLGVSASVEGKFVIPWAWMFLGIVVCVFVGMVSGLYPALKAARLDPIESLRYE